MLLHLVPGRYGEVWEAKYTAGLFLAYSMEDDGETSIAPSDNSRFNSVGMPSTILKGNLCLAGDDTRMGRKTIRIRDMA